MREEMKSPRNTSTGSQLERGIGRFRGNRRSREREREVQRDYGKNTRENAGLMGAESEDRNPRQNRQRWGQGEPW